MPSNDDETKAKRNGPCYFVVYLHDLCLHQKLLLDSYSKSHNGSSWLELFATFYIADGRTLEEDLTHPDYYEVGRLLESYRAFKRSFLQIVHMWMDPDYRFMFSPARVGKTRLVVYGITSHVPYIKAERVVNSDMANELHKALISLTTAWTKNGVEKMEAGVLKAQPKRMKWAGRIPWHQW